MPIILPPSDSQDALVDGIAQALAGDGTLLLEGGTHFTRPGFNKHIAVGASGLRIGSTGPSPLPPPSDRTPGVTPAVIRRPDHALSASAPDFNYGLFFIPTEPTPDEIAQATWKTFTDPKDGTFEFAVVMRGSIEISRLQIDCNMQNQGAESLPAHAAEHSAMLGFGGFRYRVAHAGTPRFMYVGFDSVAVDHLGFINGGFADDFWVADPVAFYPQINQVSITNVASGPRVDRHRATLSFSGLAQHIIIQDANIQSLNAEQDHSWKDAPRRDDLFSKSIWSLQRIVADTMNFAMFGKVMTMEASDLTAGSMFDISYTGGTIANSHLQVARGEDARFFLLDGMHFDGVTWLLPEDDSGTVGGITLACRFNDTCEATFTNNRFVAGKSIRGQLINSAYSIGEKGNNVTLTFSKCAFSPLFGTPVFPDSAVARVNERGTWTFDRADIGNRPVDRALPKSRNPDVILIVH